MSGANDKTGVGSGSGEWQTPFRLFEDLHQLFRFNLDAFASHENALCTQYCTADGTFLKDSSTDHAMPVCQQDGLSYPWRWKRVFCNPPYSRGFVMQAVEKAVSERDNAGVVVMLLPAAVDVAWFKLLEKYATIWFLPKRVRFINPETGQPGDSPPTGHIVALLRPSWMDR